MIPLEYRIEALLPRRGDVQQIYIYLAQCICNVHINCLLLMTQSVVFITERDSECQWVIARVQSVPTSMVVFIVLIKSNPIRVFISKRRKTRHDTNTCTCTQAINYLTMCIFGTELLSEIKCMVEIADQKGNTVVDTNGSSIDCFNNNNKRNDDPLRSQSSHEVRSNNVHNKRNDDPLRSQSSHQVRPTKEDRRRMTGQRRGRRKSTGNYLSLLFKNNSNSSISNENNDSNNSLQQPLLFRNRNNNTEVC
jgi:hypothetical protein